MISDYQTKEVRLATSYLPTAYIFADPADLADLADLARDLLSGLSGLANTVEILD